MAKTKQHDLVVLQLTAAPDTTRLERAYEASVARYQRITARGPLAEYRKVLLAETRQAYQRLQPDSSLQNFQPARIRSARPPVEPRSPAQVEDDFCREVIYRLEGELLRYTSRQELLALSAQWQIGSFRANLLMAQIVEAVRQHRLWSPTTRERRLATPPGPAGKRVRTRLALAAGAALALAADAAVIWWLAR